MTRTRKAALALLASATLTFAGLGLAAATADRWMFVLLDPGPFDPEGTPPALDYGLDASWAALPSTPDGADVALPELPANPDPLIDVFYVHPTTWLGPEWNGPVDAPAVAEATERGGTLIQASAFNACCAVWAPRYRQANGRAFTLPDERGARALDVAYGDVAAAFDRFLSQTGQRGFVVASHSQGSVLAARLLRERVATAPQLHRRLVAAYVIGGPVGGEELGGLPACARADDIGCVVAFNARGPDFEPNGFEFEGSRPDTLRRRLCTNPLSWEAPTRHVPASEHAGAVFFDTPQPRIKTAFADAQCVDGALVLTELGDLERDLPSSVLLWLMGPENYHPVEYQLFYVDLRENAVARSRAWLAAAGP